MTSDNNKYRKQLFKHLDGITIIPTTLAINQLGILDFMNKHSSFYIDDIINNHTVSKGYLNIALRNLLSIDILSINNLEKYSENKQYHVNHKNLNSIKKALKNNNFNNLISIYLDFENIINNKIIIKDNRFDLIYDIINNIKDFQKDTDFDHNLYYYIEGLLLGPILSYLGFLNISFKTIENKEMHELITTILKSSGLIDYKLELTDKGIFFNKRITSYGVTTSYLPLLKNLDQLISKKDNLVWRRDDKGYELHVNRKMNVWGSGGSHEFYFKKIDNIIRDIFNKDIDTQPRGIIDIGCGDGTFLKHCYDIIINETLRSKYIEKYPLKLIGVDINKAARIASRRKLNKNNIDNIIINGNISDPDNLNKTLKHEYNENLDSFISTRTFLDHNRIYAKPKEIKNYNIKTTGAFCYKGNLVNNTQIINNLIEHFTNWKKHVNKHGLIILELHTICPELIRDNIGSTIACAYDTTHGFSDQYLIEYDVFIKCVEYAGLRLENDSILFPNKNIPTISINYFK